MSVGERREREGFGEGGWGACYAVQTAPVGIYMRYALCICAHKQQASVLVANWSAEISTGDVRVFGGGWVDGRNAGQAQQSKKNASSHATRKSACMRSCALGSAARASGSVQSAAPTSIASNTVNEKRLFSDL